MTSKCRHSILCTALLALACGPAAAQEVSDDILRATTGKWLIASEDGSLGCQLTLQKQKTIGGYALAEGKVCGPPWHDEIAAWDFSGPGIVLRDATRKTIIGFEEQEGGPWRTPEGIAPRVYFIPEPGTMERVPLAKNLLGSWVLSDKNRRALCHFKFLDRAAPKREDAKAIELSKDCSASVRKAKIEAWQIAEIQLVIIGGEDWIYTMLPEADGNFMSVDKKFRLERDAK